MGRMDSIRKQAAYRSSEWHGRTRGGVLGNWFFIKMIRFLGIRVAHIALVPIAAYFLVASPGSVKNSRRYLRRVLGPLPWWKWPFLTYCHFYSFGMSLLDRFAILMGSGNFQCTYEDEDNLARALEGGKGVVLVGAHVGNWAAGGHLLRRLKTRVNIVALANEVEKIQGMFDRAFPDTGFVVLPSSPDLSSSLAIMNALRSGEIVVFNGDRTVDGTASAEAVFFQDKAAFPAGPYLMASVTGSPVIRVFAMRDGVGRYRFFCSRPLFIGKASGQARERIVAEAAQEFAAHLEAVLRKYPFQWYNFYQFWKQDG